MRHRGACVEIAIDLRPIARQVGMHLHRRGVLAKLVEPGLAIDFDAVSHGVVEIERLTYPSAVGAERGVVADDVGHLPPTAVF